MSFELLSDSVYAYFVYFCISCINTQIYYTDESTNQCMVFKQTFLYIIQTASLKIVSCCVIVCSQEQNKKSFLQQEK